MGLFVTEDTERYRLLKTYAHFNIIYNKDVSAILHQDAKFCFYCLPF